MLLFIIGPSASGKGTQAELLCEKYGLKHISIGELFRKEIEEQTEIGEFVKPIIDSGQFVPGHLTFRVLKEEMESAYMSHGGAVIDGFPRLYSQAFEIQPVVEEHTGYFKVIHYTLSFDECLKRQKHRAEMGGARADDAMLLKRLQEYGKEIEPIKGYYMTKQELFEINAEPSIEDIFVQTTMLLDNDLAYYEQFN